MDCLQTFLPSLIGGLTGGTLVIVAQFVAHHLKLKRDKIKEMEDFKTKFRVFFGELEANKRLALEKSKELEQLMERKFTVDDANKFFYNPHSHSCAFSEIKSYLVFAYGVELFIKLQNIYDELNRLDLKIDQFDELYLSEKWLKELGVHQIAYNLVRPSINHYKKIETKIEEVLKELSED